MGHEPIAAEGYRNAEAVASTLAIKAVAIVAALGSDELIYIFKAALGLSDSVLKAMVITVGPTFLVVAATPSSVPVPTLTATPTLVTPPVTDSGGGAVVTNTSAPSVWVWLTPFLSVCALFIGIALGVGICARRYGGLGKLNAAMRRFSPSRNVSLIKALTQPPDDNFTVIDSSTSDSNPTPLSNGQRSGSPPAVNLRLRIVMDIGGDDKNDVGDALPTEDLPAPPPLVIFL